MTGGGRIADDAGPHRRAEKESAAARFLPGAMHESGKGVKKSGRKADERHERSPGQGDARARCRKRTASADVAEDFRG